MTVDQQAHSAPAEPAATDAPAEPGAPVRARRRRDLRRPGMPRAVWVVTAAWTALLLGWSLVLPTLRSADEPSQIGAAMAWDQTHEWPGFKELMGWRQTTAARLPANWVGYPQLVAGEANYRDQRPSYAELAPAEFGSKINNLGQHPPGYYVLVGTIDGLLPDSIAFDLESWLLRLVNIMLMAPLPLVIAATTRRLTDRRAVVIAASLAPLAIPQLGALGMAVNNDNLLTITTAVVMLGAVTVAQGDLRTRTAVWTGLALAVALLTKAWAMLFVPVVVLAYLIAFARARDWRRSATGLVTAGATAALGGWWWIANLLRYGSLQPAGHLNRLPEPLVGSEVWRKFFDEAVVLLPSRFWAALSIKPADATAVADLDVQPFSLWLTLGLSVLAVAAAAVVLIRRRTFGARRADGWLLVLPFPLIMFALLHSTWELYLATAAPRGLQGRYLFAAVCGMAVAGALGLGSLLPRAWLRWYPTVLAAGALTFSAAAMVKALDFHYAGGSMLERLGALGNWAPLPPVLTVLVLAAVPCAGIALLVVLVREGLRDRNAARALRDEPVEALVAA